MKKTFSQMLLSKKFQAMLAAIMTVWGGVIAGKMDVKAGILATVSSVIAYIMAQGIADHGKEAAKINKGA